MTRGFPLAGVCSPELVWRGAGFVKKHKKTVEQFMEMCAKASNAAPQVQAFIDILTASSEFQVFVVRSTPSVVSALRWTPSGGLFLIPARVQDMMTNRERRDYFFFVMKSWRMEYVLPRWVAAAISTLL